jgi:microcystin-dependent protein
MDGYIGEIRLIAANFAPRNWAYCTGQTIAIQSNTALFSILGTTYGGNGTTTFQLPDLAGRVAVGTGQGPGLSLYNLGEAGGEENHTLISTEMPAHTHTGGVSGTANLLVSADDSTLAVATAGSVIAAPGYTVAGGFAKTLGFIKLTNGAFTLANAGGSMAHSNMQPYLGMNYIVCMYGIFPARN